MQQSADLAIVGGGSTAISFLAQLVELLETDAPHGPWRILMFEPSPDVGPGGPYADDLATNLLNIPAGKMSAYARNRGHFLEWLHARPASLLRAYGVSRIDPADFLPRPLFGAYLREVWRDLSAKAGRLGVEIHHIQEAVESISSPADGEVALQTPSGEYLAARAVLCNGNLPSITFPHLLDGATYFNSPYPVRTLVERIPREASVGVLGTSLSAIDAIVALKEKGHKGLITATSRNGRLPSVRSEQGLSVAIPPSGIEPFETLAARNGGFLRLTDIFEVLKERILAAGAAMEMDDVLGYRLPPHAALDREIAAACASPRIWQGVAISLNEVIERVWHLLPDTERQRFYADWRSLWMVRRATFPLANALRIQEYVESGALRIVPGFTACSVGADGQGYVIQAHDDTGRDRSHRVDYVVNATSFSVDVARTTDPLILSLLRNGLARGDPYGGLRLDFDTGCLVGANGDVVPEISVLGSLATGAYFWTVSLDVNSRLAFDQARRIVSERALSGSLI